MKDREIVKKRIGTSEKSALRDWVAFALALAFLVLVLLSVSFFSYMQMSKNIISDIDSRLYIGAVSVKSLLPRDFHDRATAPEAISPLEDSKNIQLLSRFAHRVDFKFLYTLIKSHNKIYITSSSATEEELAKNVQVRYFTLYDEAGSNFYEAFDGAAPISFTHKDRWGTFRALAVPEKSPGGEKYLSVAEYDVSYVNGVLNSKIIEILLGAVLLILGATPLFYIFLKRAQRISEERKRMEEQFQQAQKMESVGRLAGGIAHDYNNISSIIIGYSELALDEVVKGDPLHDDLVEILKAANRATHITRQLLAYARKQTIAPKVLDVNDIIESMLKMLCRLIGEDIELSWIPGTDVHLTKMDPSQVDQILVNLCVNSRDAIQDVGKIIIETKNTSFDENYCADHAGFVPGDYVMIAVSDDGSGIAPDKMDKIFEPFFTTKSAGKGTGLGLATVYGIVKQNNGFVNVYSEPEQGTTIRIYLPKYSGEKVEIKLENIQEIPQNHSETVLIVEDDASILKLCEKMVGSLGYNVLSSASPNEAILLATEYTGKINLLITDVVMPEINGRELSEKLQVVYPELKILFMSGYTANIIASRGVLEDGVNFIPKPFSKNDMAVKIREVLDRAHGAA